MTETAQIKERSRQLSANLFEQQQFIRNIWCVQPPAGDTLDDMLKPAYWSHVARKLNTKDKLEIFPSDNSYYAELMVISSTPTSARVEIIAFVDFSDKDTTQTTDTSYVVEWKGASGKWAVIRKSDKKTIEKNFASESEANDFLKNYIKTAA